MSTQKIKNLRMLTKIEKIHLTSSEPVFYFEDISIFHSQIPL